MGLTVTRKKKRKLDFSKLKAAELKVGWFEGVRYTEEGVSVVEVAYIQEHGTKDGRIPPRPFMRPTVDAHGKQWRAHAREAVKNASSGRPITHALEEIGLHAQGAIQQAIASGNFKELKASTIAARARRYTTKSKQGNVSAKPLVDTGIMISSVSYKVTGK